MNILTGIHNFLQFVNENWTMIIITIGLAIAVTKKAVNFFSKSDDEKVAIAKKQVKEVMLKLITDAETDYLEWVGAGAVKRSQVIEKIFAMYPILSKVTNQEEIIAWIDEVIDESLKTMREIFEKQMDETQSEAAEVIE